MSEQANPRSSNLDVLRQRLHVYDGDREGDAGRVSVQRVQEAAQVRRSAVVDDNNVDSVRVLHCRGCNRDLVETEFSVDRSKPSGRHSRCITCKLRGRRRESRLLVVTPPDPAKLLVVTPPNPAKLLVIPPRHPAKLLIILPSPKEKTLVVQPKQPMTLDVEQRAIARRNAMLILVENHGEEYDRLCMEERGKLVRARGERHWVKI